MRDIRRRYHSSKSSPKESEVYRIKSNNPNNIDKLDLDKKVEVFEEEKYSDVDYTKSGRPVMKAAIHFDKKLPNIKREDKYDVLNRSKFFMNNKKSFDEENIKDFKSKKSLNKKKKKLFIYLSIIFVIIALTLWTFYFNTASIKVSPKYKDVDVSNIFSIPREDILLDSTSSTIAKDIPKSAPKEIDQKATGEIVIYNNYSSSSQKFITNTRFQTKDGLIYKLYTTVVVPGKSGNAPGSIKAKVYADSYGKDYNIGPSDFTIPGLKGTTKYNFFYGKSVSNMTGGASGMTSVVSQDDIDNASKDLKPNIVTDLNKLIKDFSHDGYFSLYNNPLINYSDNSRELSDSDSSSYSLTGSTTLISIKKDILSQLIAKDILGDNYNDSVDIDLDNIDNLVFTLDPNADFSSSSIKILITGKARLVWYYDAIKLKNSLAGKSVSDFNQVKKDYSSILTISDYKITPPWSRCFPKNISRINILDEIK